MTSACSLRLAIAWGPSQRALTAPASTLPIPRLQTTGAKSKPSREASRFSVRPAVAKITVGAQHAISVSGCWVDRSFQCDSDECWRVPSIAGSTAAPGRIGGVASDSNAGIHKEWRNTPPGPRLTSQTICKSRSAGRISPSRRHDAEQCLARARRRRVRASVSPAPPAPAPPGRACSRRRRAWPAPPRPYAPDADPVRSFCWRSSQRGGASRPRCAGPF